MQTPQCSQKSCRRQVDPRPSGGFYRSCAKCRARRAAWQRNREAMLTAKGKCSCGRPLDRKDDGSLYWRCQKCRKARAGRSRAASPRDHVTCDCGKPRDARPDGSLYYRCPACRKARVKRRAELVGQGGCRVCYYRPRIEGGSLCTVCLANAPKRKVQRRRSEAARPPRKRDRRKYAYSRPAGPRIPDELKCRNARCSDIRHDRKPDGTLYATCTKCRRARRARLEELVAQGGCRKCGCRKREPGQTRCATCRAAKDAHNAEAKELRRIAREIDQWAAKPEPRNFDPSAEERGISRWNSRKPREANGRYWSPNPDPKPRERDPDADRYRRFRRC